MLPTQQIFLLAALFCFLAYLVLYAFTSHAVRGLNGALLAMVFGMAGNILYAFGRELPPVLAYEAANGMYAAAAAALLAAYRGLFRQPAQGRRLAAAVAALVAAVALFHYAVDSFLARSAVVSLFQVLAAAGIAATLLRERAHWQRPYYVKLFILAICAAVAAGHAGRVGWLLAHPGAQASLLQPGTASLVFLTAASLALPALAFGALMLVHRRIVAVAEHAANHDFLTGAASRRAFFGAARQELARAARTGRPLCVALVDFDHFKKLNDSAGHDAGDRALTAFATRAQAALRHIDVLGRMGGDEFAVLMPETDLAGACAVAARLKQAVEARAPGDALTGITLSIGVAALRAGQSVEELLKSADEALYDAKQHGRNRVTCGRPALSSVPSAA